MLGNFFNVFILLFTFYLFTFFKGFVPSHVRYLTNVVDMWPGMVPEGNVAHAGCLSVSWPSRLHGLWGASFFLNYYLGFPKITHVERSFWNANSYGGWTVYAED